VSYFHHHLISKYSALRVSSLNSAISRNKLLVERCFCHENTGFYFACISCVTCYPVTKILAIITFSISLSPTFFFSFCLCESHCSRINGSIFPRTLHTCTGGFLCPVQCKSRGPDKAVGASSWPITTFQYGTLRNTGTIPP